MRGDGLVNVNPTFKRNRTNIWPFFCQLVRGFIVGKIFNLCRFGDEPKFVMGIHRVTVPLPKFILRIRRLCDGDVSDAHDRRARCL